MSVIDRKVFLQIRVDPNTPCYVKDSVAAIAYTFIGQSEYTLATMNDQLVDIGTALTADSDVAVRVADEFDVNAFHVKFYELSYQNNRYKTIRQSVTTNLNSEEILEQLLSKAYATITNAAQPRINKLRSLYPDPEEPIDVWLDKLGGGDSIPNDEIAKHFLLRLVPMYLTEDTNLDQQDMIRIYQDLMVSTIVYAMRVGYHGARKYLTTEYLPTSPKSTAIQILHLNTVVHPTEPVVGLFYGIQNGKTYHYGGDWVLCDVHHSGVDIQLTEEKHKQLTGWVTDRTNRYLGYLQKEGMEHVNAVYPSHIKVSD